jgi:hypothetical protein
VNVGSEQGFSRFVAAVLPSPPPTSGPLGGGPGTVKMPLPNPAPLSVSEPSTSGFATDSVLDLIEHRKERVAAYCPFMTV